MSDAKCEHAVGYWDNGLEKALLVRNAYWDKYDDSTLADPNTEKFNFCPRCGKSLTNEKTNRQ